MTSASTFMIWFVRCSLRAIITSKDATTASRPSRAAWAVSSSRSASALKREADSGVESASSSRVGQAPDDHAMPDELAAQAADLLAKAHQTSNLLVGVSEPALERADIELLELRLHGFERLAVGVEDPLQQSREERRAVE